MRATALGLVIAHISRCSRSGTSCLGVGGLGFLPLPLPPPLTASELPRATALVLVIAHISRCSKSGTSCQENPCQLKRSLPTRVGRSQRRFRPWVPGASDISDPAPRPWGWSSPTSAAAAGRARPATHNWSSPHNPRVKHRIVQERSFNSKLFGREVMWSSPTSAAAAGWARPADHDGLFTNRWRYNNYQTACAFSLHNTATRLAVHTPQVLTIDQLRVGVGHRPHQPLQQVGHVLLQG